MVQGWMSTQRGTRQTCLGREQARKASSRRSGQPHRAAERVAGMGTAPAGARCPLRAPRAPSRGRDHRLPPPPPPSRLRARCRAHRRRHRDCLLSCRARGGNGKGSSSCVCPFFSRPSGGHRRPVVSAFCFARPVPYIDLSGIHVSVLAAGVWDGQVPRPCKSAMSFCPRAMQTGSALVLSDPAAAGRCCPVDPAVTVARRAATDPKGRGGRHR